MPQILIVLTALSTLGSNSSFILNSDPKDEHITAHISTRHQNLISVLLRAKE